MVPRYPTIMRRYAATLIDFWLLLFALGIPSLLQLKEDQAIPIRTGTFVLFLLYEPILSSRLCTLGQLIAGVRVRRQEDGETKISIWRGYVRLMVKVLLGAISFLMIPFSPQRRAIHDFAAQSVVVRAQETAPSSAVVAGPEE